MDSVFILKSVSYCVARNIKQNKEKYYGDINSFNLGQNVCVSCEEIKSVSLLCRDLPERMEKLVIINNVSNNVIK